MSFRASDHRDGRRKAPRRKGSKSLRLFSVPKENLNLGVHPRRRVSDPLGRISPWQDGRRAAAGEVEDGREGEAETDAIAVAHVGWAEEAEAQAQGAAATCE